MEDILQRYPRGVFYYNGYESRYFPELQQKLQDALPERLVIVSDKFHGYPADLGVQVENGFYCWTIGKSNTLVRFEDQTKIPQEVAKSFFPDFYNGEEYVLEGGTTVPISGSPLVITNTDYSKNRFKPPFIFIPELQVACDSLACDAELPRSLRRFYYTGHIDIPMTGVFISGGI